MAALHRLHADAARAAGCSPLGAERISFTMADRPLVRGVFPRPEAHVRANALVFTSAEPFLRCYASGPIDAAGRSPDRRQPPPESARAGSGVGRGDSFCLLKSSAASSSTPAAKPEPGREPQARDLAGVRIPSWLPFSP